MTTPVHGSTPGDTPAAAQGQAHVEALRSSVERLEKLAMPLTEAQLNGRGYPTEWTVAQVLSHLGSGAVIMQRRLKDSLAGNDTPEDFAPGVWDAWNAKTPVQQRDDALEADAALLDRIDAVPANGRGRFTFAMGRMTFGFGQFVGLRLNEHAFHTWDIEVVNDPAATLPAPVAALVVDNLDLIARFTAKPTGDTVTITVATTDPERDFTVDLTQEAATLTRSAAASTADLRLPAEAFARLVYGRLDPKHAPPAAHGSAVDTLRQVFPGP
jgi:uncharacterized protein (TIGR03083 family)